jgi:hypothetical protein
MVVVAAALGLTACTTPTLHARCSGFGSCGDEMVCRETSSGSAGTCEMPCGTDGDCAMGFRCDTSANVAGVAHVCVAR